MLPHSGRTANKKMGEVQSNLYLAITFYGIKKSSRKGNFLNTDTAVSLFCIALRIFLADKSTVYAAIIEFRQHRSFIIQKEALKDQKPS